jgi:hypothetical protein
MQLRAAVSTTFFFLEQQESCVSFVEGTKGQLELAQVPKKNENLHTQPTGSRLLPTRKEPRLT